MIQVCKSGSNICYIRLDFDNFVMSSPVTTTYQVKSHLMSAICRQRFSTNYFFFQNTNANGRGQCQTAQFTASSDGVPTPVLCGTNTGYHMILNADVSEKLVGDATASLGWSLHFKTCSSFGFGLEFLKYFFPFRIHAIHLQLPGQLAPLKSGMSK